MTLLMERGRLVTKINIIFLIGNEVLNIFHLTIFSKKNFSQNNCEKNFWKHDHF